MILFTMVDKIKPYQHSSEFTAVCSQKFHESVVQDSYITCKFENVKQNKK